MPERWNDQLDGEDGCEKDIWWVVLVVLAIMAVISQL